MKFSKKEVYELKDDKYFIFTKIEGNTARVVSRTTLDSWIIEGKDTYCILYHDHPGQKKYHEHRRFRTIADAIHEIKSHDNFTIEHR